ncbi:hypothetical protein F5888DRAFT_1719763 [Russula emetica]|nr:hypothetical protein F5888DRAFT_1719763 [Russula emetica]
MSITSERKRPPVLPVDIIYPIVDLLALDFDTENLDFSVRSQRRLQREYYCKDLLNLRIVSHTFCRIVSPRVFRTLKLTHTLSSITGFLAIIQSPWVRHHARAVRYEYWDPEPLRYEIIDPAVISERSDSKEIRQMLNHALSRLHELPSLRSLFIRFGEIAPSLSQSDRIREDVSSVLDALISLSASLTRPLESLSLTRLPPIHFPQYDHPAIRSLRAHLSFFEIHNSATDSWSSLVTPTPPRQGPMSSCEPFYYHTLPRRLLPPPSTSTGLENLESLSLCFSDPIGIYYFTYSFAELHFPRLRALRLQHAQFSDARDAERFVAQHADTLLELHLLHCQIAVALDHNVLLMDTDTAAIPGSAESVFGDDGDDDDASSTGWPAVSRPWSDIYFEFANKLEGLVYLEVIDAWWVSFPDKYVAYAPGEMMQFMEEGREEDNRALEKFKQTVLDRARKLGIEYEPVFPIRDEVELICDCH